VRRAAIAIVEYLLGFFSLAVFAAYAFAQGAPTHERWINAFKLGASLAAIELLVLLRRKALANRLVIGANLWLLIAGLAAFTGQGWVLRGYELFGEASLFAAMLLVGLVSTAVPGGFVAVLGPRRKVLAASGVLFLAVVVALILAIVFRGNIKLAAVLPVIGLSWLNRALQRFAKSAA
jgi:hypothetical protein